MTASTHPGSARSWVAPAASAPSDPRCACRRPGASRTARRASSRSRPGIVGLRVNDGTASRAERGDDERHPDGVSPLFARFWAPSGRGQSAVCKVLGRETSANDSGMDPSSRSARSYERSLISWFASDIALSGPHPDGLCSWLAGTTRSRGYGRRRNDHSCFDLTPFSLPALLGCCVRRRRPQ